MAMTRKRECLLDAGESFFSQRQHLVGTIQPEASIPYWYHLDPPKKNPSCSFRNGYIYTCIRNT